MPVKDIKRSQRLLRILYSIFMGRDLSRSSLMREFGIGTRTVQREIKELEENLGMRIQRLKVDGDMIFRIDSAQLAAQHLKPKESLVLHVMEAFLKSTAPELESEFHSLLRKSGYSAGQKASKSVSFNVSSLKGEQPISVMEKLSLIIDCCRRYREMVIRYNRKTRPVYPYGVFFSMHHWYLRAFDCGANQQKTFRIDRIGKDIMVPGREFTPDETFDIDAFLESSVGLLHDAPSFPAQVLVKPEITTYFRDYKYLPTQRIIEEREDGSLVLEYQVNQELVFLNFTKSWIPCMFILSPKHLRESMQQMLSESLHGYDSQF